MADGSGWFALARAESSDEDGCEGSAWMDLARDDSDSDVEGCGQWQALADPGSDIGDSSGSPASAQQAAVEDPSPADAEIPEDPSPEQHNGAELQCRDDAGISRSIVLRSTLAQLVSDRGALGDALRVLLEWINCKDLHVDPKRLRIAYAHLSERVPVASIASTAAKFGVSPEIQMRCQLLGSAAFVCMARHVAAEVLQHIAGRVEQVDGARLLSITEVSRYDETPMHARTTSAQRVAVPMAGDVGGSGLPTSLTDMAIGSIFEVATDSSPAKLLQSELHFVFLYSVHGEYYFLKLRCPVFVQSIQRCTGENVLQALREHTPNVLESANAGVAHRKQRFAITDRGAGMLKAERGFAELRPDVVSLQGTCDIHRCSILRDRVMAYAERHVSGLIHMMLSMHEAGGVAAFRSAIRRVLEERLVFHPQPPSPQQVRKNKKVFDLVCDPRDKNNALRSVVVCTLANGDWSDTKNVHHWCGPRCVCGGTEASCLTVFSAVFVMSLLPKAIPKFPRHRWTRAEQSVDAVCVLLVVHDIGTAAFLEWMRAKGDLAAPAGGRASNGVHGRQTRGGDDGDSAGYAFNVVAGDADDDGDIVDDIVAIMQAAEVPEHRFDDQRGTDATVDARDGGSTHRRVVGQWLGTRPLADLLVVRIMMEPQRVYMQRMLYRAGAKFDFDRAAKSVKAMPGADDPCEKFDYKVLSACALAFETEFCAGIAARMQDPSLWDVLPSDYPTMASTTVAFFMASTSLCAVKALFIKRYEMYPFRTLKLLIDDSLRDTIAQDCDTMKDAWTLGMQKVYGPRLEGPDARAELVMAAAILELDISAIEARHASLRRYLTVRSTQTHATTVADVSSYFVAEIPKARVDEEQGLSIAGYNLQNSAPKDRSHASAVAQQPPAKRRKVVGGGPWRAFVHARARDASGRPDMAALADEYHNLSEEEMSVYVRIGNLATAARRAGVLRPFGKSPAEVKLARRREILLKLAKQLNDAGGAQHELLTQDLFPGGNSETGNWLAVPKQAERAQARVEAGGRRMRAQGVQAALSDPSALQPHTDSVPAFDGLARMKGLEPIILPAETPLRGARWCNWPRVAEDAARIVSCLGQNGPSTLR